MSQINCSQCDDTFFVTKRNLVLPFVCAECQAILETQKQEPQTASSTLLTSLEILEQIRLDLENPRIVAALAAQNITVDWEQIDKDIAAIKALPAPPVPPNDDDTAPTHTLAFLEQIKRTTELIAALELERDRETFRADQWKKSYEEMSDRNTELVKTKNDIITHRESERDMALLELGHAREDRDNAALVNRFLISLAQRLQKAISGFRDERDYYRAQVADLKRQVNDIVSMGSERESAQQKKIDTLTTKIDVDTKRQIMVRGWQIQIDAINEQEHQEAVADSQKKAAEIDRLTSDMQWVRSRRDYWVAQWREKCEEVRTLDRELAVHPLRRLLRASWKYISTWRTR